MDHSSLSQHDDLLQNEIPKAKFWDSKAYRFVIMFGLTFSFMLAEVVTGIATGSLALVSDAFHMTSDAIALVIGFAALQMAKKGASDTYSFGWSRSEIIGSLVNGVFLLSVCFFILTESIQRFLTIEEVKDPLWVVGVGTAGLIVNLIGLFLFSDISHGHSHSGGGHGHSHGGHGHSHGDELDDALTPYSDDTSDSHIHGYGRHDPTSTGHVHGKPQRKKQSTNMQAVFLHILGDLLGSVAAVGSGLAIYFFEFDFRYYFDPIASLVIAVLIFITAAPLVLQCIRTLMQSVPKKIDAKSLRQELLEVPGVVDVHDLHIWQLIEEKLIGTVHVVCLNDTPFMRIAETMKAIFHKYSIHSSTIQPEFVSVKSLQEPWDLCQLQCETKDCDTCCPPKKVLALEEAKLMEFKKLIEFSDESSTYDDMSI